MDVCVRERYVSRIQNSRVGWSGASAARASFTPGSFTAVLDGLPDFFVASQATYNTRFKLEKADESAGGGGFVHDGWLPMWAQVALLIVVVALLGAVCGCTGYWLRGRHEAKNFDDEDRSSEAQVLPAPQRV